jgi:ABC-type molybdate transport system permease subunit
MVNAPLVMPEVVVGLSLLLMLVSCSARSASPSAACTIWLGHLLLGMAYATVVVQARLQDLNPQLEEAAMDLGARPAQVFWLVTLPMIAQSLVSAWLLTFTLSLDDVVLSAFLSGPGATTMPLVIFSRARLGLNPSVNAVATITVAIVAIGVIVASYLIARAERRARPGDGRRRRAPELHPTLSPDIPTPRRTPMKFMAPTAIALAVAATFPAQAQSNADLLKELQALKNRVQELERSSRPRRPRCRGPVGHDAGAGA